MSNSQNKQDGDVPETAEQEEEILIVHITVISDRPIPISELLSRIIPMAMTSTYRSRPRGDF